MNNFLTIFNSCFWEFVPQFEEEIQKMSFFPENFRPGRFDVVFGRGQNAYNHIGNFYFRELVRKHLPEYSCAKTKADKSIILQKVVMEVTQAGHFVRLDRDENRWFEVNEFLAKEKTSQFFRDALHDQYKSSNEYKKRNRRDHTKRSKLLHLTEMKSDLRYSLDLIISKQSHFEDFDQNYRVESSIKALLRESMCTKRLRSQLLSFPELQSNSELITICDQEPVPLEQIKSFSEEFTHSHLLGSQNKAAPFLQINNEFIAINELEPVPFDQMKSFLNNCPTQAPNLDEEEKQVLQLLVSQTSDKFP